MSDFESMLAKLDRALIAREAVKKSAIAKDATNDTAAEMRDKKSGIYVNTEQGSGDRPAITYAPQSRIYNQSVNNLHMLGTVYVARDGGRTRDINKALMAPILTRDPRTGKLHIDRSKREPVVYNDRWLRNRDGTPVTFEPQRLYRYTKDGRPVLDKDGNQKWKYATDENGDYVPQRDEQGRIIMHRTARGNIMPVENPHNMHASYNVNASGPERDAVLELESEGFQDDPDNDDLFTPDRTVQMPIADVLADALGIEPEKLTVDDVKTIRTAANNLSGDPLTGKTKGKLNMVRALENRTGRSFLDENGGMNEDGRKELARIAELSGRYLASSDPTTETMEYTVPGDPSDRQYSSQEATEDRRQRAVEAQKKTAERAQAIKDRVDMLSRMDAASLAGGMGSVLDRASLGWMTPYDELGGDASIDDRMKREYHRLNSYMTPGLSTARSEETFGKETPLGSRQLSDMFRGLGIDYDRTRGVGPEDERRDRLGSAEAAQFMTGLMRAYPDTWGSLDQKDYHTMLDLVSDMPEEMRMILKKTGTVSYRPYEYHPHGYGRRDRMRSSIIRKLRGQDKARIDDWLGNNRAQGGTSRQQRLDAEHRAMAQNVLDYASMSTVDENGNVTPKSPEEQKAISDYFENMGYDVPQTLDDAARILLDEYDDWSETQRRTKADQEAAGMSNVIGTARDSYIDGILEELPEGSDLNREDIPGLLNGFMQAYKTLNGYGIEPSDPAQKAAYRKRRQEALEDLYSYGFDEKDWPRIARIAAMFSETDPSTSQWLRSVYGKMNGDADGKAKDLMDVLGNDGVKTELYRGVKQNLLNKARQQAQVLGTLDTRNVDARSEQKKLKGLNAFINRLSFLGRGDLPIDSSFFDDHPEMLRMRKLYEAVEGLRDAREKANKEINGILATGGPTAQSDAESVWTRIMDPAMKNYNAILDDYWSEDNSTKSDGTNVAGEDISDVGHRLPSRERDALAETRTQNGGIPNTIRTKVGDIGTVPEQVPHEDDTQTYSNTRYSFKGKGYNSMHLTEEQAKKELMNRLSPQRRREISDEDIQKLLTKLPKDEKGLYIMSTAMSESEWEKERNKKDRNTAMTLANKTGTTSGSKAYSQDISNRKLKPRTTRDGRVIYTEEPLQDVGNGVYTEERKVISNRPSATAGITDMPSVEENASQLLDSQAAASAVNELGKEQSIEQKKLEDAATAAGATTSKKRAATEKGKHTKQFKAEEKKEQDTVETPSGSEFPIRNFDAKVEDVKTWTRENMGGSGAERPDSGNKKQGYEYSTVAATDEAKKKGVHQNGKKASADGGSMMEELESMSLKDMMGSIAKSRGKMGHPYGAPVGNVYAYGVPTICHTGREPGMPEEIPTTKTNGDGITSKTLDMPKKVDPSDVRKSDDAETAES